MTLRRVLLATFALGLSGVALASNNESVTFNEPQPGGTLNGASQSITAAHEAIVGVKGDLDKTTVVVEGGIKKHADTVGNAVAACWLAGPGAIPVDNAGLRDLLANDTEINEIYDDLQPDQVVFFCMAIVRTLAEKLVHPDRAVRSAPRCTAKPLSFRIEPKGKRTTPKLVTAAKARPKTRYTCSKVKGGIKLRARAKGKPLAGELGPKLDYGMYKSTDGPPSNGKMTMSFRLR